MLGRLSANAPSGGCECRNNSASVMKKPELRPNARRHWLTSMRIASASGWRLITGRNHCEFASTSLTSRRWPRNSSLPTNLSHAGWSGRGRLPGISIRPTSASVAMTNEPTSASLVAAMRRCAAAIRPCDSIQRPMWRVQKLGRRHHSPASRTRTRPRQSPTPISMAKHSVASVSKQTDAADFLTGRETERSPTVTHGSPCASQRRLCTTATVLQRNRDPGPVSREQFRSTY